MPTDAELFASARAHCHSAHDWQHYADQLYSKGRFAAAVVGYDQAVALDPTALHAHHNKAAALYQLARLEEALTACDVALALAAGIAEIHKTRASILQELGRSDEALGEYAQALALKPDFYEAHHHRASLLRSQKRYDEALLHADLAIALRPSAAEAYANRAHVLLGLLCAEEALTAIDTAIALAPDMPQAHSDRGDIFQQLDRYDDALVSYDRAISLAPGYAEAHHNKGFLLQFLGDDVGARAAYDCAIALKPDFARAYFNKATLALLEGDFAEGWPLYEWRWQQSEQKAARNFMQPLWLGDEDINDKTILLHAEQGFGDTLQFCRFVQGVAARGAHVVLEVPPPLAALMATLPGDYRLVNKGETLPLFDVHCPLMSLPLALGTTLATLPAPVPYLHAPAEKRAQWAERLGEKHAPRLGLCWSGAAVHKNDRHRSLPLSTLAPLLDLGFEAHALQKDIRAGDGAALGSIRTHAEQLQDFTDTAALIEAMDLVITVDTSVAHLAGALGKPVWIMLPFTPDYRWLRVRADSPWYPSARLFRQPTIGDWQSAISAVVSALNLWR